MSWIEGLRARLRNLLGRAAAERRMDEEIGFHLEMETEKNLRAGLNPGEARRRALLAFGGVEKYREEVREGRGLPWAQSFFRDLRYAARSLRRSPGFTISAVLTLALGTGAATGIAGAVHTVLLSPLPYPLSDRLVRVFLENSPTNRWGPSVVDYRAIEAQQRSFSAVGAVRLREVALVAGDAPETARAGAATEGFFAALGVRPARGRAISAADETPGGRPVTVIGHALATRAFGGDSQALGRAVTIDGVSHEVVGVLPEGMRELAGIRSEVWPALRLRPPERRGPFGMVIVARLKAGVTLDAARADLSTISARIFPQWSSSFQDRTAVLIPIPLREAILGSGGRTMWMFALAVGLVLLIALANVAGLMLVRATGRSREWALRSVLGASRRRLARQLLTESMALTVVGGVVGLALASALLRVLRAIGPDIPRLETARLDPITFGIAIALALLSGLLVGCYPVVSLFRSDLAPELRSGDREVGAGRRTSAVRGAFVAGEVALALPLLTGAALLLNSFLRLQRVDPGFDPGHVLTLSVTLPAARYPQAADVAVYWSRSMLLVRDVPGVVAAAVSTAVPPEMPMNENNFDLLDHPVPVGTSQPVVPWPSVTPSFFDAIGVRLLRGRTFTPGDTAGAPPVVVVSRAWERRYSPEHSAVGRRLVSGGCTECPPTTIVGVVGDVKYGGLAGGSEAAYEPLAQGEWRNASLLVRTAGSPGDVLDEVRRAMRSMDPEVPLDDARTLEDRVYATIARPRHWATLLGAFAASALALSAVGIFGMLSYFVATRRREIGVRVAMGARRGEVVAMIVRRGMTYAAFGGALGAVGALLAARSIRRLLFEVGPYDPAMLGAAGLVLLAVALGACWLPARRAARIDPMEVMRSE